MRDRFSASMITVAIAMAAASSAPTIPASAQAPAASGAMPGAATLKTPWGDPDLQGIWTDETNTPLERPAKFAIQEFFTEAQRAELDKARMALPGKDKRAERGTEIDVTGSYNQVFLSRKRTGARIVGYRSTQWPDSSANAGRGEDGCGGAGISPRPDASDRDL